MKDDNLIITEEKDIEDLKKFITYKNNLMHSIGINNFINKMKEIIDNSKHFEFRSLKSKMYINKDRPIFILKIKDEYNKKIIEENFDDLNVADKITSKITDFIKEDIIFKVSKFIMDCIQNDKELKECFDSFDETLKDLCASNVFGIRNSIKDNIIYLEYFR